MWTSPHTSERIFVDTNVLLYSLDTRHLEKHERARAMLVQLWESRNAAISTQVLAEFSVNLKKKLGLTWRQIEYFVSPYLHWSVTALSGADVIQALRIADRNRISYWDSQIVRGAQLTRSDVILTEDLAHGQTIEGVKIVNPFL